MHFSAVVVQVPMYCLMKRLVNQKADFKFDVKGNCQSLQNITEALSPIALQPAAGCVERLEKRPLTDD